MEDQFSRTDLIRREALAQAIMWASHRAVPQTLGETLGDACTIEAWLLNETRNEAEARPGELVVLQPGETHLDAARRRRGWPPAVAHDPLRDELKRLDSLQLNHTVQIDHLLSVVRGLVELASHPMQPQWLRFLEAAVFAGSIKPAGATPPADRG